MQNSELALGSYALRIDLVEEVYTLCFIFGPCIVSAAILHVVMLFSLPENMHVPPYSDFMISVYFHLQKNIPHPIDVKVSGRSCILCWNWAWFLSVIEL